MTTIKFYVLLLITTILVGGIFIVVVNATKSHTFQQCNVDWAEVDNVTPYNGDYIAYNNEYVYHIHYSAIKIEKYRILVCHSISKHHWLTRKEVQRYEGTVYKRHSQ